MILSLRVDANKALPMLARRLCRILAAAACAASLGACQQVPMLPGLQPYRMDIQQGNVVTQEMVAKLKPGMTRQQVRFVMGTPPIADTFHQDRWDYVYYLNKRGRVVEHRRIVLLFDGDTLKRIEGDVIPVADAGAKSGRGGTEANPSGTEAKPSGSERNESGKSAAEEKKFVGRRLDGIGP
jgi:outer membrane protein assembly factor BamE